MLPSKKCAHYSQFSVLLMEDIFIGSQIREVLNDKLFDELTLNELREWEALKSGCHDFLDITRVSEDQEFIERFLQA